MTGGGVAGVKGESNVNMGGSFLRTQHFLVFLAGLKLAKPLGAGTAPTVTGFAGGGWQMVQTADATSVLQKT